MPERLYLCKGERCTEEANEWLLVTCFDPQDPQFRGILRILTEIRPVPGRKALSWAPWTGRPLEDSRLHASHLLLSGHGSEDAASLGDNRGRHLVPAALANAVDTDLYLLCCYQGQERFRRAWAHGCRLPVQDVHGAEEETETLLTTLLLLHLCLHGAEAAPNLFDQWTRSNRLIGPYLPQARERYRRAGRDPLPVLDFLQSAVDLSAVEGFLDLARELPQYLSGIGA